MVTIKAGERSPVAFSKTATGFSHYAMDFWSPASSANIPIDLVKTGTIDLASLDGKTGFRLDGAAAYDFSGECVSSAGDVNGDGFDDLIVGADWASPNGQDGAGSCYVVFGKSAGFASSLNYASLNGQNGFRLDGMAGDAAGTSVSSAGDVNGDGFDDLIVGADGASPNGQHYAGTSYVVFGKASGFDPSIDLAALNGQNGFRLDGVAEYDFSGRSVSSAGDVNGDGLDDLIVGASRADPNGNSSAGSSYVVFGKLSGFASSLDLATLNGETGFRLDGVARYDASGSSVSSAGDVNGDGYDDLLIGADEAEPNGNFLAGSSYVVFGKASGFAASTNLSSLNGITGFRLDGVAEYDASGTSVSSAGDINGDGFDDLIIGTRANNPYAYGHSRYSGAAYVVFGQASQFASAIDLATLDGKTGFRLDGRHWDLSGTSVSSAGDVNGDGFDDLIIGAYKASPHHNSQAGSSYVMFGKASGFASSVDLSTLSGNTGFRLDGVAESDNSGTSVSSAGDVNGDGFDDLIIGADKADPNGNSGAGSSYVVFGGNFTGAVTYLGSNHNDVLNAGTAAAERFVSGNGDDKMAGGGGADVFNGGQGNDVICVPDLAFNLVDGGSGNDILALKGAGLNLNLAEFHGKIENIETISLTGSGDNSLTLSQLEVLNLSDSSNRLTVNGNAGDRVVGLANGWNDTGVSGGYHSYSQGQATVLVGVNVATDYPV